MTRNTRTLTNLKRKKFLYLIYQKMVLIFCLEMLIKRIILCLGSKNVKIQLKIGKICFNNTMKLFKFSLQISKKDYLLRHQSKYSSKNNQNCTRILKFLKNRWFSLFNQSLCQKYKKDKWQSNRKMTYWTRREISIGKNHYLSHFGKDRGLSVIDVLLPYYFLSIYFCQG